MGGGEVEFLVVEFGLPLHLVTALCLNSQGFLDSCSSIQLPVIKDVLGVEGSSSQAYSAEIMKAWRAAEERERGQFGDLRPPPPDNRVNVNTATSAELEELPGIGPSTTAKIIAARPLRSNSDIKKVEGIGPATWIGIKDRVKVR